jgi:hypothetical protein
MLPPDPCDRLHHQHPPRPAGSLLPTGTVHHPRAGVPIPRRSHPTRGPSCTPIHKIFGSNRFRIAVSNDGSAFFDGLVVDNATGIVDQPRLSRFKAYTNYDNYVGVDTWKKIGINNTEVNDQGAFDAGNNRFVAPVAGTYLFGASLLFKINSGASARMRGRTALWLQTMVPLAQGDTVELKGIFRAADGYFAADHTTFWGCKIG